jgi:dolichol kinase
MNGQIFYDIIFVIAFLSLVPFFVKMGWQARKFRNIEGYYNSFSCAGLLTFICIYYLTVSIISKPIVVYPFNVLMLVWIAGVLVIQGANALYKNKFEKKTKSEINSPKFINNKDFTFFHEIKRKSTHLVGLLLIICYFWISIPVFNLVQQLIIFADTLNANIWGMVSIQIAPSYIPQMISIFAIFCAGFLITLPDIFRIFNFRGAIFKNFSKVMRGKERNAVGPHVCLMIGSLIPMILIPNYLISIAGIIIAVFSDAMASLVGRKFGKHKLPFARRTGKTYEGLLGGFLTAFLLPIPVLLWGFNVATSFILALVGAIVVSIIDVITPLVTDNILNPILASFTMYGIYLLLVII